jgi:hypothetical protein
MSGIIEEASSPSRHLHRTSSLTETHKGIKSLSDVKIRSDCSVMDLSDNKIRSFEGLPDLPLLVQLNLDRNPIRSFEGCRVLPELRWLSVKGSPVSHSQHFKLMCLVSFGPQLKYVNSEKIPEVCKKQADELREVLLPALQEGQILVNLKPLRLLDAQARCPVQASDELLNASISVGFTEPRIKELTEGMKMRYLTARPSVAALCDRILATSFIPSRLATEICQKIADLRNAQNGVFIGPSIDDDTQVSSLMGTSDEDVNEEKLKISDPSPAHDSECD